MLLPNWSGVFITCVRRHERQAEREILDLFYQYLEEQVPELGMPSSIRSNDPSLSPDKSFKFSSDSFEDQISQEVALLKRKELWLQPINIKTACGMLFSISNHLFNIKKLSSSRQNGLWILCK
ncbi:hypothetical protein MERGE_001216 [Pneumocystis wakefieldiae]|uniref:Uncharacterized protein n=1 Tax=Pneumocystis wakefieldiae TaxID=38082 RepID=A0A899G5Z9_9ASCO|nr:hypothetical protein MERGE_001216 [Pneumocystis wakefieldiae]